MKYAAQPHYPDEKRVERLLGVVVQGLEILYKEVQERSARTECRPRVSRSVLRRASPRKESGRSQVPHSEKNQPPASLEKRLQIAALKYRVELHGFEPASLRPQAASATPCRLGSTGRYPCCCAHLSPSSRTPE